MFKKLILPFIVGLFLGVHLQAQSPQPVLNPMAGQENLIACPPGQQNMAGTVSLGTFTGQSNDIDLDTMYLCLGDQVEIIHNGDAVLTGDPDLSTPAGIGYAFYDCLPTVTGDDLTAVGADPCLVPPLIPGNLFFVATEGNLNGDILFFNDGNLINIFNGGNPALYYWTPITFDALSVAGTPPNEIFTALYENNGPCVNANVGATIPVVYLNGIAAFNQSTSNGLSGCGGSFDVTGGLPEFDNSNYSISISLSTDPTIIGSLNGGTYTHGENVEFSVPQPGTYDIVVEDGKSCGTSFQMTFAACNALSLDLPEVIALPGENICLPITATDFNDIVSMQFTVQYDPNVLVFTGVANENPVIPDFNMGVYNDTGGEFILSWFDFSFGGVTIPDGGTVFELCFDVVGNLGDCTDLVFVETPLNEIEITSTGGPIDFVGLPGEVCVSNGGVVANIVTDSVSCPGFMDGAINVTASNGVVPYEVTWENLAGGGQMGPGFINTEGGTFSITTLPAGQYIITVTDAGPAQDFIDTVEVSEGPTLNVIFTPTPPQCNGGTGALTAIIVLDSVVINNPGADYTFNWSNGDMMQTVSGITSGLYSVTITDVNTMCTTSGMTFLPQTPPIVINTDAIVEATCSGVTDGSIAISVSGGTPAAGNNYDIFWPDINGGTLDVGSSSTVTNLDAGDYLVEVTDGNGCTVSTTITVGAIKTLGLLTTGFNELDCFGDCDGSVEVTAFTTGGVSNTYTFGWSGTPAIPPPGPTNGLTTSSVGNLCAGVYTVVLTDDQGCQIDTTYQFIEPDALVVSLIESLDESCNVGGDGSATVGVTGGTYPYTYTWSNGAAPDSIITGLSMGVYTVTVEDQNACMDSLPVTINMPTPPTILSFDNDTLNCATDLNGSLTITTVAGGSPIINYNWSNGQTGPAITTINNLTPGSYSVTITAADGCEQVDTAEVIAPAPLMLDSTQTILPICPGDGGGGISVFISGGTGPYFYEWSEPGFIGEGVSAIGGGTIESGVYFVTVTDANSCPSLELTIPLDDPPSIEVDFTSIAPVSCFENQGQPCDGMATATASYSDGTTGVFNFSWSSGENEIGVVSSTAMELCQDQQEVVVSDGTCSVTETLVIPSPEILAVGDDELDNPSCFGSTDGSVTVTATGGTGPYSYSWDNMLTGPMISNIGAGSYAVTITDNNMCEVTYIATLTEPDPLVGMLVSTGTVDSVSCFGEADAVVTVTAEGGNIPSSPALNFQWDPSIVPSPGNTDQATGLAAGSYSVTVSDILGCSDVVFFNITSPDPIQFDLGPVENILCPGGTTTITVDTAFGGNGFNNLWYNFSVDNATGVSLGLPIEVFAGTHIITVSEVSGPGCSADTTIFIPAPPDIVLEYPPVVEVELGDSVILEPDALILAAPLDSIVWTPTTYLTFDSINLLEPQVRPIESQLYSIQAFDINGCLVTAQVLVEVDKNRNVYIPNIFTPNGDGFNDFFQPFTGTGVIGINSFTIYDRWGELVHSARQVPPLEDEQPAYAWDGTFNGQKMNAGVFVYLIEVAFEDGQVLLYRGTITLIR